MLETDNQTPYYLNLHENDVAHTLILGATGSGKSYLANVLLQSAQKPTARTVQYHAQDIVAIHAKLKYTTLIQLPPTEKIMEAATGDKDFWIVDVVGNFCFVHPAKPGISSNLNLITDIHSIKMRHRSPSRRSTTTTSSPTSRPTRRRSFPSTRRAMENQIW